MIGQRKSAPSPAAEGGAISPGVRSAAEGRGTLVLTASHVSKEFRISKGHLIAAVRDVSLGLYRGAVVALVGESGSGKSTVARLLAGQEVPTHGDILLDDTPVHIARARAYRSYKRHVQMVFQDPFASLNPVHTVRYQLQRPLSLNAHVRGRRTMQRELAALLEQVRLTPAESFLTKFPHELSGGQRQRVAIARALASRPRVLLADEPVSMLDVSIRVEILSLLDSLRSEFELAVLYITHDIASARYFGDETLVMYAGAIVERGPSEALTRQPAHPYTQLLIESAPDPDALRAGRARLASHARPRARTALTNAQGCPFAPRCPWAEPRCEQDRPPLIPIGPERAAACWRVDVTAPALAGATGGGTAGG